MSKFVETPYVSTKEILKFPDHYVALAVLVDNDVLEVGGKKIVPKGTIVGGKNGSVLASLDEPVVNKFFPGDSEIPAEAAKLVTGTGTSEITYTAVDAGVAGNNLSVEYRNPKEEKLASEASVEDETKIVVDLKNESASIASGNTDDGTTNAEITWTSLLKGKAGNDIVVILQDPREDGDLSVEVAETTIIITLASSSVPAITTIAKDIVDAIMDNPQDGWEDVADLVSVAYDGDGEVEVTDQVLRLSGGSDGTAIDTATNVIAALDAEQDVKDLVSFALAQDGGAGEISPAPAENLSGGKDLEEITDPTADDAEGVLLNDVDVTHGPKEGAMVIHGFIAIDKLPYDSNNAEAAAAAGLVLPGIKFIK